MKYIAQYNGRLGKYFARSISSGKTVTTKRLMSEVAKASTVAPADVAAVLQALSEAMCDHLCDGDKVKLDNIGTFYLMADASGNGVATEKEVTASQINRVNVRFAPEKVRIGGGGGKQNSIPALANGNITWERAENTTETNNTGGSTGGNTGGGDTPGGGGGNGGGSGETE